VDIYTPSDDYQLGVFSFTFKIGRGDLRFQRRLVIRLGRELAFYYGFRFFESSFSVAFDQRL